MLCQEFKSIGPGLPYIVKTKFGWSLFGSSCESSNHEPVIVGHSRIQDSDNELHCLVEKFWTTEGIGTEFSDKEPLSMQDRDVLLYLKDNSTMVDGHYEVSMLWKPEIKLGDNLHMAKQRYNFLNKRFLKDDDLFKKYQKIILDYVKNGFARKLTQEEADVKGPKTWYLPHHPVFNPNKPGKVRPVFDAAAKLNGYSLNDNLITGPDLINTLIGILLRFRKHRIAIIADIEGMYYQVRLTKEDCDCVCFL